MCEPTSLAIASFALSAGAIGADQVGKGKQKKATQKAANETYADTIADLQARIAEENTAAGLGADQTRRQGRAARSSAQASAAEAGVAGKSVDLLLRDFVGAEGEALQSIDRNRDSRLRQIDRQKEQAATYRDNQMVSTPGANPYLAALELGGAGVDLATTIAARKPKVRV